MKNQSLKTRLMGGIAVAVLTSASAYAANFDIPRGELAIALDAYQAQSGVPIVVAAGAVRNVKSAGVKGDLPAEVALSKILKGTGFVATPGLSGVMEIIPDRKKTSEAVEPVTRLAEVTAPARAAAGIESVVVTSSKIKGDIQTVPIAITALSQEQLTSRQIAGGPDLVKEVPNLTFSKTNFTGYNIQIRGIGTQAISVTTDPAVAVAFNDMPFIRNHFFEQEFYDVNQVEVLRGPQGTLYGRNATAGVVNIISAKPTDQFEAMLSADIGNYHNRRYEGMINIPIVDDRLDIRAAAEWTKRDGYSFDQITNQPIDGRDLWSGRVTVGWKPTENVQTYLIWEHFQEGDDRLRSGKQLCKTDLTGGAGGLSVFSGGNYLSQGCLPVSLYSPEAFEVPNGTSLPYVNLFGNVDGGLIANASNPYASTVQSRNLRVIESTITPTYLARNDTVEFNADYIVAPEMTFSSQTGYNNDFLFSAEDYNRFNSAPGFFALTPAVTPTGYFCDPQLGCANRLVAEDLSDEHSWQLSQEFRLASNFSGPLNFSVGGNFLHYETAENYYVFINAITAAIAYDPGYDWVPGISDNSQCFRGTRSGTVLGFEFNNPKRGGTAFVFGCTYLDPNPISKLNNEGHNYFLSQNPYTLNSYAGFGEVYYDMASNLKLTGGLRWTDDRKHFVQIPSWLADTGYGYPIAGAVDQQWKEWTGRFAANWTPKLDFTDQTLIYGTFARGYKAGGANPPGAMLPVDAALEPTHPLIFKPEFIDAYELGTKNTLLDGALQLNGNVFYYNYKDYQISQIVDRTSVNLNFNATVKGAEIESTWEPAPGLKFSFAGGYEDTRIANGQSAIDLMDRADVAHHPDWQVVKSQVQFSSNCILPVYVVQAALDAGSLANSSGATSCNWAYQLGDDPVTEDPYQPYPTGTQRFTGEPIPAGYPGFDPTDPNATNGGAGPAPNNGQGFDKDLSGNQLPNAPHFTTSLTGEYTLPVSEDWAATLHSDFYWQSQSFARVENDRPYDKIRGYSSVNLVLILTSASGWQVLGYLKNVFDTTAITGDFLNSDDSGLTTNVFLTDPRLYGVRVTKNF